MNEEKTQIADGVASKLNAELGCVIKMKRPKEDRYYKPLEEPRAYPLELTENLHICLWDKEGEYKWIVALWRKNKEGYSLEFIGDRPLNKRVKWKKLKAIIKQGQAIADKRFNKET